MKKPIKRSVGWRAKDKLFSICYLGPFLILFFLFTILPVGISIILSFTDYNVFQSPHIVYLKNYLDLLFSDDEFLTAVKNTFIIAVITGPVGYFASLFVAWFINDLNPKIRPIMVLFFYAPSISGGVYMIWQIIFSSDAYGYANSLLMYFNIIDEPIQWFTDTKYMLTLVIIVVIWQSLGAGFLSFVAGLRGIDRSYYEVGYIEGIRNRWQELWYVTLPSMKPQLMFGAVMSITSAFGVGDITMSLCGFPSTDYAAHTIINHLHDYGSVKFEMGYASAIATILFAVMVGSNKLVQKAISNVGK